MLMRVDKLRVVDQGLVMVVVLMMKLGHSKRRWPHWHLHLCWPVRRGVRRIIAIGIHSIALIVVGHSHVSVHGDDGQSISSDWTGRI